ncbi:hypothetical protein RFM68_11060 [Mesorhizobium sp. MSK_1335]|uniref:Acetyltransferase n=1 Tax=Mesorhizobium montanum TaxID=3072323 RepID=A0ABU4ZI48_9HYPH|nr:hypothetical protein [Mesorhizobium sp. MSK_1335]MDX8525049.1 hypothetical protein [Mesorhizobium sp. MSK_1335]
MPASAIAGPTSTTGRTAKLLQRFYERLGFKASHSGYKVEL